MIPGELSPEEIEAATRKERTYLGLPPADNFSPLVREQAKYAGTGGAPYSSPMAAAGLPPVIGGTDPLFNPTGGTSRPVFVPSALGSPAGEAPPLALTPIPPRPTPSQAGGAVPSEELVTADQAQQDLNIPVLDQRRAGVRPPTAIFAQLAQGRRDIDTGMMMEREAVDTQLAAVEATNVRRQAVEFERQGRMDEASAAYAAAQAANDKITGNLIEGFRSDYEEYKKASNIDPKRLWADKSTGDKFLASIAVGLGAFAQGMGAGPNTALKIMDDAIDRDIRAQEGTAREKRGVVEASSTLLAHNLARIKNRELAIQKTKNDMMAGYEAQLDNIGQQGLNDKQQAGLQAIRAQLEIKKGAMAQQLAGNMLAMYSAGAGGQVKPSEESEFKKHVPHFGIIVNDDKEAARLRDATGALNTTKQLKQEMIENKRKAGLGILTPGEAQSRNNILLNRYSAAAARLDNLAQRTESEMAETKETGRLLASMANSVEASERLAADSDRIDSQLLYDQAVAAGGRRVQEKMVFDDKTKRWKNTLFETGQRFGRPGPSKAVRPVK